MTQQIPHLGIYQQKMKALIQNDICTPISPCSLQHHLQNPRYRNNLSSSADKWITMEFYSAVRKNEIVPFNTTRMDIKVIMVSEIVKRGKTNTICSLLHVKSKNKTKNKLIDTENRLVVARGGGWGGGVGETGEGGQKAHKKVNK